MRDNNVKIIAGEDDGLERALIDASPTMPTPQAIHRGDRLYLLLPDKVQVNKIKHCLRETARGGA
jgi:hypothetical protein